VRRTAAARLSRSGACDDRDAAGEVLRRSSGVMGYAPECRPQSLVEEIRRGAISRRVVRGHQVAELAAPRLALAIAAVCPAADQHCRPRARGWCGCACAVSPSGPDDAEATSFRYFLPTPVPRVLTDEHRSPSGISQRGNIGKG